MTSLQIAGWDLAHPGANVMSSDGWRVGEVAHALCAPAGGGLDGLVVAIRRGALELRFVDGAHIREILDDEVVLDLPFVAALELPLVPLGPAPADEVRALPRALRRKLVRAARLAADVE